MVINSLLLILVNTLPLFILLAFFSWLNLLSPVRLVLALCIATTLTGTVFIFSMQIDQWWQGAGIDVIRGALTLLCFPSLCMLLLPNSIALKLPLKLQLYWQTSWGVLALISVSVPCFINYLIYINGLWQSQNIGSGFFIGMAMGIGISSSVAIILFLAMDSAKHTRVPIYLLNCFVAGQVASVASTLEQINWLQQPARLWDTNRVLAEQNEYGQLLHILIGYEATPTQYYLYFYLASLLVLGLLMRKKRGPQPLFLEGVVK